MAKRATTTSRRRPGSSETGAVPTPRPVGLGSFEPAVEESHVARSSEPRHTIGILHLVVTSIASVVVTLGLLYFLFGNYFAPASYLDDRAAVLALQDKVSKLGEDLTLQIAGVSELSGRNSSDISSIADQIGQQVDGFWVPLTFDLFQIGDGQQFILPIDARHDVRMMITASNTDLDFLQRYLTLYINNQPITPIEFYVNANNNNRPRKLKSATFDSEQNNQTFELRVRRDLSASERVQFEADLASARQRMHADMPVGRISVLLVVKRPILTSGNEENLPPPGG